MKGLDTKKIWQFIGLTFLISWTAVLMMRLAGININSLPGTGIITLMFMPAPAYAVIILQKAVYKEKLADYGLTLKSISIRGIVITIILMVALVLLTFNIEGLFGNVLGIGEFGRVSFSQAEMEANMQRMMDGSGLSGAMLEDAQSDIDNMALTPLLLFFGSILSGIIVGFTINLIFALGEELGWRGLLLDELRPLGLAKATLIIGLVWGIWHAPLIVQGYNYSSHSWPGVLMMILFTTALTLPFIYARYKTGTVLGSAAFHGMLNGMAGMTFYFFIAPDPLFGSMMGVAGIASLALISAGIVAFDSRFVKDFRSFK